MNLRSISSFYTFDRARGRSFSNALCVSFFKLLIWVVLCVLSSLFIASAETKLLASVSPEGDPVRLTAEL